MKKKTKILVATPHFNSQTGGVSTHTYNLYKRLSRNYKFKVIVVTTGGQYIIDEISGMKVYKLPFWFKLSNTPINPLWFFEIRKIIKKEKPEIVIGHTPVPFLSDMAFLASGGVPYVVKYHHAGSIVKGKFPIDLLIRFYELTLLRFMFKKAKIIITSSDFLKDNFLKDYSEKTLTITPGVDIHKFKPKKMKSKSRILIVVNLNKAERYKGLEYILKAIPLIRKKVSDARLIVVGKNGDDTDHYKKLCIELGIEGKVDFRGRFTHEKMVEQYQNADIVVIPSLIDSCPNVLLEAMATELPVAGSNASGIPYLIEHGVNGCLFPAKDHKKLANMVIKILSNPEMANRMGKAGLKKVKNKYTWDAQTKKTAQLIERLLKTK